MKRLLKNLLAITIISTGSLPVIACSINSHEQKDNNDYDIAVAINKSTYSLNVGLLDKQETIKQEITPQVIKSLLDTTLQSKFIDNKLSINEITYNDCTLTPEDLGIIGAKLKTLLTLSYGGIIVETKLNLLVCDQYQNQVANAIKNGSFQWVSTTDSSLKDLQKVVNNDFIKSQLDKDNQKRLRESQLQIKQFLKDNKPIVPSDFNLPGTFFITVNFQYYDINSNFILKMILNPNIVNQVIGAIDNTVYSKTVIEDSKVDQLKTNINSNFIKEKLIEPYNREFKDKDWTLINLLKSDKSSLEDKDLLSANNLDLIIQFTYSGIKAETSLEINVVKDPSNVILEAIENINIKYFYLTVPYGDGATYFTADFIKQQLSVNLQEKFQADKYQFIKMEWTGMDDGKLYYNYKLHFSYNNEIGVLPIIQANDLFSRFLSDPNIAKLEIKSNSMIKDLTDVFWTNFRKYVFDNTDPKYKNDFDFVITTFQFQLMGFTGLDGKQLNDKDLANKGTISVYCAFIVQNIPTMMPFKININ